MQIRHILLASLLPFLVALQCGSPKATAKCLKGKLAIKGICMNYTLQVIEGNIDTAMIESQWKDPDTGKVYDRAFGLEIPCGFPPELKEGDEFYFTIDTSTNKECMVCQAYRATPSRKLHIRVLSSCK